MSGATRHYVLAAGGTGGHLIPAFALARELEQRGHHVALITDARGAAIPGRPAALTAHVLPAGRISGWNPLGWLRGLAAIAEGRRMALRLFDSFEPSAVVGFGGYPALPALLAATSAKIPTVIHEQNAVLGRVNRFLAGRVDAIATAYAHVDRLAEKHEAKVHLVGNPVREEVLSLRDEPFPPFTEEGLLRILVTGGSQGPKWCRMASRCCRPRCGCACKSPSNAARKTSRRCAGAMPGMIFPLNWALISRTWRPVLPTRTCSSAAPAHRPSPN
jgi:UDP-N-acetylglucosamine--N-acetylmuramyl-(pentapeptide) pyrophosphoryl-undecaprenol N-acetylglucosamine transferase